MGRKVRRVLVALGLVGLGGGWGAGCAHRWEPVEAQGRYVEVQIDGDVVVPGERVNVYARVCPPQARAGAEAGDSFRCVERYVGEGRVTSVNEQKTAIVRLPPGVQIEQGQVVVAHPVPAAE